MSVKVNARLRRSHRRTCPYKHALTMETAQEYLTLAQGDSERYQDPTNLELYVCTNCNFLHIGHPPKWRK